MRSLDDGSHAMTNKRRDKTTPLNSDIPRPLATDRGASMAAEEDPSLLVLTSSGPE